MSVCPIRRGRETQSGPGERMAGRLGKRVVFSAFCGRGRVLCRRVPFWYATIHAFPRALANDSQRTGKKGVATAVAGATADYDRTDLDGLANG